jgi:hypothetical protein
MTGDGQGAVRRGTLGAVHQRHPAEDRRLAARLKDLLFPTDEKNWGIGPTPVPTLADRRSRRPPPRAAKQSDAAALAPQQASDNGAPPEQVQQLQGQAQEAQQVADEAKEAANLLAARMEEGASAPT